MKSSRRDALKSLVLGAGAAAAPTLAAPNADAQTTGQCPPAPGDWSQLRWGKTVENQRCADLGDGTYLNPIIAGDHPDPTILKDGADYYMTHSSFDAYPGVVIWHSRDLVNWQPIGPALRKPIGSVWACDIAKVRGRYFIYIPARTPDYRSNYVIHAPSMRGPWSAPIGLH